MGDLDWTNDTVIRLLEEYKSRPQLWDATHEMYRFNRIKYETWCELAALFEVDVVDVRKKLNSVFASHRREKARVRAGHRSTWFLYPNLSFLPSHVDDSHLEEAVLPDQKNSSNVRILNESISASASSEDQGDGTDQDDVMEVVRQEIIIKEEPERKVLRLPPKRFRPELAPRRLHPMKTIKKKISLSQRETTHPTQSHQTEGIVGEVLRLLRRADNKKKDSCDSFGEYIADSLRKHDDKTQAMIKQAINNIIFEQEMQKYQKGNQYTVVISGVEGNPLENSDDDK